MISKALFSSGSDEYATPQKLYDELDSEFHFDLDPCSTDENCKCKEHYTAAQNGLNFDWGGGHRVFCNPPYSDIARWVKKCWGESTKPGTLVVMLIPSRTDTRWFHEYIQNRSEVRFIKGRLHFNDSKSAAPFPSMIVIFRSGGLKE